MSLCERSFKNRPENSAPLWYLAAAHAHLGNQREAEAALAKLREFTQYASSYWLAYFFRFKNPEDFNLLANGLRKVEMN